MKEKLLFRLVSAGMTLTLPFVLSSTACAQTMEELGWTRFNYGSYSQQLSRPSLGGTSMWVPSKGAFRTAENFQDDTIYLDDNAFMGWAMSKTTLYSWSGNQYATALRAYIISMTVDSNAPLRNRAVSFYTPSSGPEFYKGHVYKNGGWTIMINDPNTDPSGTSYPKMPDGSDSAIVSFAPSLALVAITTAYPTMVDGGQDRTSWLYAHIDRTLSHQNEIVLKAEAFSSGEDKRLSTASIASQMLASAYWYQFRNDVKYLNFAKNAWDKIKLRQVSKSDSPFFGVFVDFGDVNNGVGNYSVLRHTQVLAAVTHSFKIIGDYNNLNQAMIKGSNALKTVTSSISCGNTGWTVSQGLYIGSSPCTQDGNGGLGYGSFYREQTITDGFAYLSQLCHQSPQALTAMYAINAAARRSVNNGNITGTYFNTFAGNRSIAHGLFTESSSPEVANDPLFVAGTLEGNALAWLAKWWQTQNTGC